MQLSSYSTSLVEGLYACPPFITRSVCADGPFDANGLYSPLIMAKPQNVRRFYCEQPQMTDGHQIRFRLPSTSVSTCTEPLSTLEARA